VGTQTHRREPGWYSNPDNPAAFRYWDGKKFTGDLRARDPSKPIVTIPKEPGWHPDPENTQYERHWDGAKFTGAPRAAAANALPEGWYLDPTNPANKRFWSGTEWTTPATGTQAPADTPPNYVAKDAMAAGSDTRGVITGNYIGAALFPLYGWIAAIYIGTSEKYTRVRRHAFGIAAVAVASAAVYVVVILLVTASHRDSHVASDLQGLLSDHGINATNVNCSHQSGNLYQCFATINGRQQFATVTDDGHAIYEQGISANGG
jgi:Protein of unknown function (DUF2510)